MDLSGFSQILDSDRPLAILLRSVEEWNAWRRAQRGLRPNLSRADLSGRDLSEADFTGAFLIESHFSRTRLDRVNFTGACLRGAVFADTDLTNVLGLDLLDYTPQVSIDLATLFRSRGYLPVSLLSAAGVPRDQLPFFVNLFCRPNSYRSCFLSYSSADEVFAGFLAARLQQEGVPIWFAPAQMRVGDPIPETILPVIAEYECLLVVLSRHSAESAWVGAEVFAALEQIQRGREILILPLLLEEIATGGRPDWWRRILERWHALDVSAWQRGPFLEEKLADLLSKLIVAPTRSRRSPDL